MPTPRVLTRSTLTQATMKAEHPLKWLICRQYGCTSNYQSEHSSLKRREMKITTYVQRTCKNILNLLHQAHSVCSGCGFWRGSALTFSDSKYGLCHHVYWLPADGRAVLNHCNGQQDRRGVTGLPLSTWGPLMQALRVWPHSAFVLTSTNKYTHSEGKQSPP